MSLKRILIIASFVFVLGVVFQLLLGPVNISLLKYPVNMVVGLQFLVIITSMHLFLKKTKVVIWLSSAEAALASVLCFLLVIILMAIIPQNISSETIGAKIGYSNIVFTWYYALSVFFLLTVLALTSMRRFLPCNFRNMMFFLNHSGMFIALCAAVLGQADKKQLYMQVPVNTTVWYAENEDGYSVELPFALHLSKFVVEYHPRKVALISHDGQLYKTKGNAVAEAVRGNSFFIGPYRIRVFNEPDSLNSILLKVSKPDKTTMEFSFEHLNDPQTPLFAKISNDTIITLLPAEPSYFGSEALLYTKSGKVAEPVTIAVNKPLKTEGWDVYQHSYNNNTETEPGYSVLYLVYDPWLPVVYIGIALMLAGAVLMLFARKKNEIKHNDLE